MKLSSQSDGMTPFLTMSLARSPDASISATIPEGPAAFASFHLGDNFHHHLNIYMRANNRVSSQVLRIPRKLFIQKPLIVLFPSNFGSLSKESLPESSFTHLSISLLFSSLAFAYLVKYNSLEIFCILLFCCTALLIIPVSKLLLVL